MKYIKLLAMLYIPIFLVGAFLVGLAIILTTVGMLLMLETDKARNGFNFMKRSFLGRR